MRHIQQVGVPLDGVHSPNWVSRHHSCGLGPWWDVNQPSVSPSTYFSVFCPPHTHLGPLALLLRTPSSCPQLPGGDVPCIRAVLLSPFGSCSGSIREDPPLDLLFSGLPSSRSKAAASIKWCKDCPNSCAVGFPTCVPGRKHLLLLLLHLSRAGGDHQGADSRGGSQLAATQTWDTELEAFAQAYAEKCIWDHNKERGRRGENLFAMAPILDLEFAVEDWNAEEKYYNFSTATCVPGQMCGHYTQVVWASTHQIGCGSKFCEKIDGLDTEDMYLLVCNYYPPGNVKGRKPYREGPSCSQCPQGRVCVNSLCAGSQDTEEQEADSDMDQPTAGAPTICLGLSLFLLPSVILVSLLL